VLRNRFFKWYCSSLKGHMILFQLLCAMPLSVWSILTMRSEGTPTVAWAIHITRLSSALLVRHYLGTRCQRRSSRAEVNNRRLAIFSYTIADSHHLPQWVNFR
jgi:hypothetical protein